MSKNAPKVNYLARDFWRIFYIDLNWSVFFQYLYCKYEKNIVWQLNVLLLISWLISYLYISKFLNSWYKTLKKNMTIIKTFYSFNEIKQKIKKVFYRLQKPIHEISRYSFAFCESCRKKDKKLSSRSQIKFQLAFRKLIFRLISNGIIFI